VKEFDYEQEPDSRMLREAEVSKILNVSQWTLQDWRRNHTGPPYVKLGKAVRYPLGALRLWVANQTIEPNAATN
jgi:predicted DNA-binding transcriptional regulator AlpA